MTGADPLHRLDTVVLPAGVYWHVYGLAYGALASHPCSTARLALVADRPRGVMVRDTFYLGWSPDAALWETVLRDVAAEDGVVRVPADTTTGRGLARLRLRRDLQLVALDHPARRRIIDHDTADDQRWDGHLTTRTYKRTHVAAGVVDRQFREAGRALPGFRWFSRQAQAHRVAVLYAPEFDPADWVVEEKFELDSPTGRQAIIDALTHEGLALEAELGDNAGDPPEGEDL